MVLLDGRGFSGWVDAAVGPNAAGCIRNLVLVGAFAAMQFFYLRKIAEYRPRQRRYAEAVALLVTVAVILITPLFVKLPFSLQFTNANIQHPPVLVFFLTVSAYLVYACLTQIVWSSRDILPLYRERAWDFLVVAVSLTVGCSCYLILLGARITYYWQALVGAHIAINFWSGGLLLIRTAVLAMLLAVIYPAASDDIRRALHRAGQLLGYVRLGSLDSVVRAVYPELVRPDAPAGSSDTAEEGRRRWPSRLSCELREARCSDGYTLMYNVYAGYNSDQRANVAIAVNELRQMPDELPERARTGQAGPLMEVSRWLRRRRVPQVISEQHVRHTD